MHRESLPRDAKHPAKSFAGLGAFSKASKVFWPLVFPLTISAAAFGDPFPGSVVVPVHFPPDEQAGECAPLEGDEGIEVAGSGGCPVGGQEDEHNKNSGDESPKVENRREHDEQDADELEGITQLKAGLCEVADSNQGHIENDLRDKPAGLHGKLPKDQRPDYAEGIGKRAGRVERSQLEAVDDDFKDEKLGDDGNSVGFGNLDKIQPWRDPAGILNQQGPDGC